MWQRDFGQCGFRSLDIGKYSFTRYRIFSIKRPRLLFQILPIESSGFFFLKGATFLCKKKFAIFFFFHGYIVLTIWGKVSQEDAICSIVRP